MLRMLAVRGSAAGLLALALAFPLHAEGFAFTSQGAKATGLGGAFTALADDPTALYYNPGGLALLKKKKAVAGGFTAYRLNEGLYQGLAPGPGAGTTGEQETPLELPAHLYVLLPLGEKAVFGLGAFSPFLHSNQWSDKGGFAGRYVALRSEIRTWDLNPTISFAATENLGLGLGLTYRSSDLSLLRRYPGLNPFTGRLLDVGSLAVDSDLEGGFGWNVGLSHRIGTRFAWGLAYRSAIEIDHQGVGQLTQIPTGNAQLDQLFAASLPFGPEISMETSLTYPEVASLGVAVGLSKLSWLAVDVSRTGWQEVSALSFRFASEPELDQTIALALEESLSYRVGLLIGTPTGMQFRFGAGFEESPQPDETVGPFLADADRSLYAAGFGLDWLDVAFSWTTWEGRVVTTNVDEINGNWRTTDWRLVITLKK
ncbi:MAG TPA: outer membrane protein transport protein [Thermoanaerobaculia bacterium]|nr:outer membrane protein transport protein [Thermoanaerobaculia bacterium]